MDEDDEAEDDAPPRLGCRARGHRWPRGRWRMAGSRSGVDGERGGEEASGGTGGERERQREGASGRDGWRPRRRGGLILPRRRRGGAAGTCPCSDPGRGNREGEGDPGRWARPAGPGVGPVGPGSSGGASPSPFFLCLFCFLLYFLFIYLFSFLFYFNLIYLGIL